MKKTRTVDYCFGCTFAKCQYQPAVEEDLNSPMLIKCLKTGKVQPEVYSGCELAKAVNWNRNPMNPDNLIG